MSEEFSVDEGLHAAFCFDHEKPRPCEDCGESSQEIVFDMIVPKNVRLTKRELEENLEELCYFGVSKRKVEEIPEGFRLTFDRQEWLDSWSGVGFPLKEGEEAEAFEEELKGSWLSDIEGYEEIKIVKKND